MPDPKNPDEPAPLEPAMPPKDPVPQPKAAVPPPSKTDAITTLLAAGLTGAYQLQQAFYAVPGSKTAVDGLIQLAKLNLSLHHKLLQATVATAARVGGVQTAQPAQPVQPVVLKEKIPPQDGGNGGAP